MPIPFKDQSSSLSGGQAKPNADDTVTYVVSSKDPGVHNWIDTTGLRKPSFAIRWQGIPDHNLKGSAVRKVQLVAVDQVKSIIGDSHPSVSRRDRQTILKERRAEWDRRITCR